MREIKISISITCPESQYFKISSMMKTVIHALDLAVEAQSSENDFLYTITGTHPESAAKMPTTEQIEKAFTS